MQIGFSLDKRQDWIAISGMKNLTHTTVRAIRQIAAAGDPHDRAFTVRHQIKRNQKHAANAV